MNETKKTASDPVSFHWVGGATWILEILGVRIACDPVLCPAGTRQVYRYATTERLEEPVYMPEDFRQIDLWLITHNHADHLDEFGLRVIDPHTTIVTHANAAKTLAAIQPINCTVLEWGERLEIRRRGLGVTVEAMPAIHGEKPLSAKLAGGVNGYWLTISRDADPDYQVYVTSDTVTDERVLARLRGRKADLLIPNMGAAFSDTRIGAVTLSAAMVSRIVELIQPEAIVPVHFGTFNNYVEPIETLAALGLSGLRVPRTGETFPVAHSISLNHLEGALQ